MRKIVFLGTMTMAFLCCLVLMPQALAQTPKTITGQVLTSGGSPVNDATITATLSSDTGSVQTTTTDGSGNYSIALASGNWSVAVGPTNYTTSWNYYGSPQIVTFTADESSESRTKNFTVTPTDATITGTLMYSHGAPAPNSIVTAVNSQGKGSSVQSGVGGVFSLPVLAGTYTIEIGWHPERSSQAFSRQTAAVASGGTTALGTITASAMDSTITGSVTGVSPGFGEGMTLWCWQKDGNVTLNSDTDANKTFNFSVSPGTWYIAPGFGGQSHHFFMREPVEVVVSSHGETVSTSVPYVIGDYFVAGNIKDEDGNDVNLSGGGTIYVRDETGQTFTNFIEGSNFQIIYPSDYMTENISVGLILMPNFTSGGVGYSFKKEKSLVMDSDHGTTNLVVKRDAETIFGQFVNMSGAAITTMPVSVRVVAADGNGNVKFADVNENGTYSVSLADGDWKVGYQVLAEEGTSYFSMPVQEVSVGNNANVSLNLTLGQTNSNISGTVLDKDGNIVAGVSVIAQSGDYTFQTDTGASGIFNLNVLGGQTYSVTTGVPATLTGNLTASSNLAAGTSGVVLQMQAADAVISGNVYLGGSKVNSGYVKAWADNGASSKTEIGADGSYSLNVSSGQAWNIAGASVSGTKAYLTDIEEVAVSGNKTLDLTLGEQYYNYPTTLVYKWQGDDSRVVTLGDGTTVQIPSYGAVSTNQQVTLKAVPTIDLVSQADSKTLAIGYSLEMTDANNVEISSFNQPVTTIFTWSSSMADNMGADESDLEVKYWDNDNSVWKTTGMSILNTDNNTEVIITDHFTDFSLTTSTLDTAKKSRHYVVTTPGEKYSGLVKLYNYRSGKNYRKFGQFYTLGKKKRAKKQDGFSSIGGDFNGDTVDELVVYSDNDKAKTGLSLFTKNGTKLLKKSASAVYPFGKNYGFQYQTGASDLNLDGKTDLVVAGEKQKLIKIYKYKNQRFKLYKKLKPFKSANKLYFELGDVSKKYSGDELIVWAGNNSKVKVYSFTRAGKFKLLKSFSPYGSMYDVDNMALGIGDVNNKGLSEIIIAPKNGVKTPMKIYRFKGKKKKLKMAAKKKIFGGDVVMDVDILTGDVNADGRAEILVAEGDGLLLIRAYKLKGKKKIKLLKKIRPFKSGKINVQAGDLNHDGRAEVVVSQESGKAVKIYRFISKKFKKQKLIKPYGKKFMKGVNVSLLRY